MLRLYFYPGLISSIQDKKGSCLFSARRKKDGTLGRIEVIDVWSFQGYDIFLHGFRVRWDGTFAMPYIDVETFGMRTIPRCAEELTIVPKAFALATVVEKFEGGQSACVFSRKADLLEITGLARRVGGGLVNLFLTAQHDSQDGTTLVAKSDLLLATLKDCYWYFAANDMRVAADPRNTDNGPCWTCYTLIDTAST